MRSKGLSAKRIGLQLINRFFEVGRHHRDPLLRHLCRGHFKDVPVDPRRRSEVVLHPVKTCVEHHRKGEIGIAGRIRATDLGSCRQATGGGNADQCRTVGGRPGAVDRRFVTGHQALVGVDQRIGHRGKGPGILQGAGDIGVGHRGELQGVGLVKKGVGPVEVEQRLVGMHPGAVDAKNRLGHKGGVEAIAGGNGFYHPLKGDGIVGGGQGIGIFKIDLVLALGHFVVGSLDFKTHFLKRFDDLPATVVAHILGVKGEIAGDIAGDGGRQALLVFFKEEKLRLSADVHGIAECFGFSEDPFEVHPGAAFKGLAVGLMDIADYPRSSDAILVAPGQEGKGVVIGLEVHIGLVDPHKAVNRRTIKHDIAVERFLDLAFRQGHIFHEAEDIDKLKAKKLDVFVFNNLHNFFSGHRANLLIFIVYGFSHCLPGPPVPPDHT